MQHLKRFHHKNDICFLKLINAPPCPASAIGRLLSTNTHHSLPPSSLLVFLNLLPHLIQFTYRFHDFIQYGRLVWLTGSHIPFIDLQELPQLFDVHIFLLSPPFLVLALVNLRLRLKRKETQTRFIFGWPNYVSTAQIISLVSSFHPHSTINSQTTTWTHFVATSHLVLGLSPNLFASCGCRWTRHSWCHCVHYSQLCSSAAALLVWCGYLELLLEP